MPSPVRSCRGVSYMRRTAVTWPGVRQLALSPALHWSTPGSKVHALGFSRMPVLDAVVGVAGVEHGLVEHRQLARGQQRIRRPVRRVVEPHLRHAVARAVVGEVHRDRRVEVVGKALHHRHHVARAAAAALVHHREGGAARVIRRGERLGPLDHDVQRFHLQVLELLRVIDREAGAAESFDAEVGADGDGAAGQDFPHAREGQRPAPEAAAGRHDVAGPALGGQPHLELHVRVHGPCRCHHATERRQLGKGLRRRGAGGDRWREPAGPHRLRRVTVVFGSATVASRSHVDEADRELCLGRAGHSSAATAAGTAAPPHLKSPCSPA